MQTEWIAIESIETASGRRPVDQAHVKRLAASIKEIGLQTPLTVMARKDVDGWRSILVAGAHRLAALRLNGEEGAECFVLSDDQDTADLWEIDENFARSELTDAQRADHHVRREEILVRKGLVSSPGKGGNRQVGDRSYSANASAATGQSKRAVERDLARGKNIAPEIRAEVTGTALDKGVVLDELARTPQADQRAKLAEITLRRQEAERVRKDAEAVNKDTDRVVQMTDAERFAEWLLARTDLAELPTILSWIDGTKPKDVSAALRRLAH